MGSTKIGTYGTHANTAIVKYICRNWIALKSLWTNFLPSSLIMQYSSGKFKLWCKLGLSIKTRFSCESPILAETFWPQAWTFGRIKVSKKGIKIITAKRVFLWLTHENGYRKNVIFNVGIVGSTSKMKPNTPHNTNSSANNWSNFSSKIGVDFIHCKWCNKCTEIYQRRFKHWNFSFEWFTIYVDEE